jgi:uncharacterized protein (TIGR02996 family)
VDRSAGVGDDGGMSEREAFIESIAAAPDEDTPRLALADWLDEHGDPARAEFVRLQCRLARASPNEPETGRMLERVKELFARHWPEWLGPVCGAFGQSLPRFPKPRRLVSRILDRVRRRGPDVLDEIRRPLFYGSWGSIIFDSFHPSPTRAPLRCGSLDRGFFTNLSVWASEGVAGTGLRDVFRVEPVTGAGVEFLDPERDWDRTTGPHLRRLRQFNPRFPGHVSAPPDALLGQMFDSEDLAGVTELDLSGPVGTGTVWDAVPGSWVRLLTRSKMGPRLGRLWLQCSAEGVAELSGLPERAHLRSLGIHGQVPGAPNPGLGTALARLPFRARLSQLRVSFLQDAAAELEDITAAGLWPCLESLDWSHTDSGDRAAEILARSGTFPALTQLQLAGNVLTDHGARALAGAAFLRRLRSLALSYQGITDAGAAALAEALAGGAIESLELCGGQVTETGRRRLTEILGPRVDVRLTWG